MIRDPGLCCPRGCQVTHTPSCLVQREIVYLGQVGALDHLAEIGGTLGLHVPPDAGTYVTHPGPTGRTSAFAVYEKALTAAQDAISLAREGGQFASEDVTGTWGRAVANAMKVRSALLRKGHPVPGRHHWLKIEGGGSK